MIPDPSPVQSIASQGDTLDILDTFPNGRWGRLQFAVMADGNVMFSADSSDGLHNMRFPLEVLADWVEKQKSGGQEVMVL